jgi:hypothetical protein
VLGGTGRGGTEDMARRHIECERVRCDILVYNGEQPDFSDLGAWVAAILFTGVLSVVPLAQSRYLSTCIHSSSGENNGNRTTGTVSIARYHMHGYCSTASVALPLRSTPIHLFILTTVPSQKRTPLIICPPVKRCIGLSQSDNPLQHCN